MARRLFTIFSVLSLLLWVVAVVVWLDSYGHWDEVQFGRFDRDAVSYSAISFNHQLRLARVCNDAGLAGQRELGWEGATYPPSWHATPDAKPWDWGGTRLGFTAGSVTYKPVHRGLIGPLGFSGSALIVGMPPWFPCAVAAILPIYWLARRRPRRAKPGRCPHCGCDLGASEDRCPECGTAFRGEPTVPPIAQ